MRFLQPILAAILLMPVFFPVSASMYMAVLQKDNTFFNVPISGASRIVFTQTDMRVLGQWDTSVSVGSVRKILFSETLYISVERCEARPAFFMNVFPNPFNPSVNITYRLLKDAHLSADIYNACGQKLRSLIHASVRAGQGSLVWNGCDNAGRRVASGLYLLRLRFNRESRIVKLVLME